MPHRPTMSHWVCQWLPRHPDHLSDDIITKCLWGKGDWKDPSRPFHWKGVEFKVGRRDGTWRMSGQNRQRGQRSRELKSKDKQRRQVQERNNGTAEESPKEGEMRMGTRAIEGNLWKLQEAEEDKDWKKKEGRSPNRRKGREECVSMCEKRMRKRCPSYHQDKDIITHTHTPKRAHPMARGLVSQKGCRWTTVALCVLYSEDSSFDPLSQITDELPFRGFDEETWHSWVPGRKADQILRVICSSLQLSTK